MEECLITNIVCSNSNKKCKICKLDKCKEVLNMIDVQQSIEDKYKILEIKKMKLMLMLAVDMMKIISVALIVDGWHQIEIILQNSALNVETV